jgi:hypothetical protein
MYLLFVIDQYYPNGGWNDFADMFDTLDEAKLEGSKSRGDYYHIVELSSRQIVAYGDISEIPVNPS